MQNRSILVFALTAMVSALAFADAGAKPVDHPRKNPAARAANAHAGGLKRQAGAERREARAAHRTAKAHRAELRAARATAKQDELSRPRDYSRDFQVAPGPDSPFGTTLLSESFDAGIPAGWAVVDNAGSGVVWTNLVGCGEAANFSNGAGDVACVSSDRFGVAEYDTELQTPVIDLSTYVAPATLTFNTNYQNYLARDFFEVDVSTNGAAGPWTNLLSWNESHGTFRDVPGEAVNLDIASVVGQANVMFRFHYFDPVVGGDWDWYAQVDDVVVNATQGGPPPSIVEVPTLSELGLAGLALLLAGAGFVVLRRQH